MNRYLAITDVYAREILDSRGNPTIEVEVLAGDEFLGRAAVPSGASTGQYEAVELRDREERYGGLGVQRAVDHVNTKLAQAVIGLNVFDQAHLDQVLLKTDGTQNKSRYGSECIAWGFDGCCENSGKSVADSALCLSWRSQCEKNAGSDDEYFKWRTARR